MRIAILLFLFLMSFNISRAQQEDSTRLYQIGEELFTMLRQNNFNGLDTYLLNAQNFEDVVPLYQLSQEEEQKMYDQKEALIEGTRLDILTSLQGFRKHCKDNKAIKWKTVDEDIYVEVFNQGDITAGQITFSPGTDKEWCEVYITVVKIPGGWMIEAVEY